MQNEKFVIVGAYGGVGTVLARELKARGAQLVLAGRDEGKLAALAREVESPFHVTDARRSESVNALFDYAKQTLGGVTGAVNLAGSVLLKPAHLTSDEEWRETIATNLDSAFFVTRAAARLMQGVGGSIVLVSSVAARHGLANHEAIAAAKGGIQALTLSAAASYAHKKVRVNAIAPGLVQTPLTEGIISTDLMRKASISMHPLKRLGEPADIASAIEWFLDPRQTWVTGQILGVDGGLGSVRAHGG